MKYVIIGLGNPGNQYEKTRHNAGWQVLDFAYPELDFARNSYANAGVAKMDEVTFVKPATFMNASGETVKYFIDKESVLPENIIVMYDDVDLPLGKMKISFDRGSGGHNGIKSIEENLGSRQFIRIRIGISKILEDGTFVKPNVLGNFEPDELIILKDVSKKVKLALEMIITDGREAAMNAYNNVS